VLRQSIPVAGMAAIALAACSDRPSDADLLAHVERVEQASPSARIEIVEYRTGDGWSDGVEGVIVYRLCDPSCRTKRLDASFQKAGDVWKPVGRGNGR
jgi:hypothetical protein